LIETIKSTEVLVKEGFEVMVYCTDDPILSKKIEDVGACAVMPLGAPIGSGLGIQNKINIKLIKEQSSVPVIVASEAVPTPASTITGTEDCSLINFIFIFICLRHENYTLLPSVYL
jgi:thiazole synthase